MCRGKPAPALHLPCLGYKAEPTPLSHRQLQLGIKRWLHLEQLFSITGGSLAKQPGLGGGQRGARPAAALAEPRGQEPFCHGRPFGGKVEILINSGSSVPLRCEV